MARPVLPHRHQHCANKAGAIPCLALLCFRLIGTVQRKHIGQWFHCIFYPYT